MGYYSFIIFGMFFPFGINLIDKEFTQCLVFFGVCCSPSNTWPKWAAQFAHSISVLCASGSGRRLIAFGKFSSNAGQPQFASNFAFEENNGVLHFLQINVPSS